MSQPASESANLDLFRYLAAEERGEYITIMSLFTASLLADMSAATVAEQLVFAGTPLPADVVENRCKQLVRWGNLVPSLRDARVRTVAEYLRARSRYQVSTLGGRVHRGAIEIIAASGGAREVARELLGQIAEALEEIPTLLDADVGDERAERLAGVVTTIFNNQRLFSASVTDFYAYLSGVLSRFDLGGDEYAQFKTLLLDYVDLINADVNRHAPAIAAALDRVLGRLDQLLAALEALPGLDLGGQVEVERSQGRSRQDWRQLQQWYSGAESGPGQLRNAAGQALGQLIANAKRILDSSRTGYSRRADLLRLAGWLDRSSEDDAARLFTAAFGTWPARHLGLGPEEPDPRVTPTTSWTTADPIDVPISLRERGNRVARGRTSRIPDPTADRKLVEAAAREEARRHREAAAELATCGPLDGARISPAARAVLLDQLARLLTVQSDPAMEFSVTDPDLGLVLDAAPGGATRIESTDGILLVDGCTLSIRAMGGEASSWHIREAK
ncbi:TIGR02677 family protein [Nocardia abscessus]|uniref:TIGR02677 family protein n=1 Tax=Nocardia abscessus TaxID=120957 RepID=A0ABS0C7V6_9NOCA|nr:TIGR02677 family protein [Nocardia abscessus]MBF6225875.1 TIGR02677 family protein [Nocardia abscessus]